MLERQVAELVERMARLEAHSRQAIASPAPESPAPESRAATTAPPGPVPPYPPARPSPSPAAGPMGSPIPAPPASSTSLPGGEVEWAPPVPPGPAPAASPAAGGVPVPPAAPQSVPRRDRSIALEDLFGTRVLAWLGGVAVILGVAFFVAVAIGRGWIDESTRIALAFAGSLLLLGTGVWLYERRGRTQAALALVGAAIASLYLTLTAANQLYDLLPVPLALGTAFAVGATATVLAVRWRAPLVAGLGIVGALLAPVLVDAGTSSGAVAFVIVALASATAVLVWQRWDWLALAAFVVSAPQLVAWSLDSPSAAALVAAMSGFWALYIGAALGYELRVPGARLRPSSTLLIAANAVIIAAAGHFGLRELGDTGLADAWLAGLAIAHLALSAVFLRSRRVAREIALLLGAQGIALADLAFGLAASGPALPIGWAAGALLLTRLPRLLAPAGRLAVGERWLVQVGLGAHLMLAIGHALLFDAPPGALADGLDDLGGGIASLCAVGVAAVLAARFGPREPVAFGRAFDVLAMATLAYLSAVTLDGAVLAAAWAAEAVALAELARRERDDLAATGAAAFLALAGIHVLILEAPLDTLGERPDDLAGALGGLGALAVAAFVCARATPGARAFPRGAYDAVAIVTVAYGTAVVLDGALVTVAWAVEAVGLAILARRGGDELAAIGALALLILAGAHVLFFDAPPDALVYGVGDLLGALGALAALVTACLACARVAGRPLAGARPILEAAGAAALVYLGSVAIIDVFQPGGTASGAALLDLDVRQQGQVVLSAFWSVTGLTALVLGLVRDVRRLRLGGLVLLALAIAKVFLYDLSTLDSIYRVLSFVGLGLLLLAAAFAYQRMRPHHPDGDMREAGGPP